MEGIFLLYFLMVLIGGGVFLLLFLRAMTRSFSRGPRLKRSSASTWPAENPIVGGTAFPDETLSIHHHTPDSTHPHHHHHHDSTPTTPCDTSSSINTGCDCSSSGSVDAGSCSPPSGGDGC